MSPERAEFRICYPLMGRPRFRAGKQQITVLDLSASALRLDAQGWESRPRPGDRVSGEFRLAQGVDHVVRGCCQRVSDAEVVVLFDAAAHVPMTVIFAEQRCLRSLFPDWNRATPG